VQKWHDHCHFGMIIAIQKPDGDLFFKIEEVKMKKTIKVNRVVAAVIILTVLLFTLPAVSFGWNGCVFRDSGIIDGLNFPFADEDAEHEGLELNLNPDPENPIFPVFTVTDVVVEGSGKEKSYITPFNQYIYRTKLKDNWIDDNDWDIMKNGKIFAYLKKNDFGISRLVFTYKKVRLFETYHISKKAAKFACENNIEPDTPIDPTKMKIYFEVKKAELTNKKIIKMVGFSPKFNVLLILKNGIPDLTMVPVP
jgi:hypothetical protein